MKIKRAPRPAAKPPAYEYHVDVDGVTQGALALYLECRERARKAVLLGLSPRLPSMPLIAGSIGHEFCHAHRLSRRWKDGWVTGVLPHCVEAGTAGLEMTSSLQDDLREEMAVLEPLLRGYHARYRKDDGAREWVASEAEFRFLVDGTPVRGKIDGAFRAKPRMPVNLLETKFKARWDEATALDWLPLDLQTGLYITALRRDEGLRRRLGLKSSEMPRSYLYDVVRKPQLRRRKDEGLADFSERVALDVKARASFYFVRFSVELDDAELARHEARVIKLVREFRLWALYHHAAGCKEPDAVWTSAACEGRFSPCPFLAACSRGDHGALKQRKVVYPELAPPQGSEPTGASAPRAARHKA